MDKIQVKEGDILWSLYCKHFTLQNKEVPPPKNLCNYFWTAVGGLILWPYMLIVLPLLMVRLRIWWFWTFVSGAGLTVLAVISHGLLEKTPEATANISVFSVLVGVFTLLAMITFMFSVTLSMSCFKTYMDNSPRLSNVFALSSLVLIIIGTMVAGHYGGWTELIKIFYFFVGAVVIGIIGGVTLGLSLVVYGKTSDARKERVKRLFSNLWAMAVAQKRKICPLVEPPLKGED